MTERVLATVRAADGYAGILKAFRDRQAELGLSGEKLDEIIGNDGNRSSAKWLSGVKSLGPKSWGDALGGTGMKLVFVEDEKALERLQKHIETRNDAQVRTIARIRVTKWLFTPRSGRKAAKIRARKLTKEQRRESARHAATTRWERVRRRRAAGRNAPGQTLPNHDAKPVSAPEPVKALATHPRDTRKR